MTVGAQQQSDQTINREDTSMTTMTKLPRLSAAREALDHLLSRSPIVTRRSLLAQERNAFQLGVDYGEYVTRDKLAGGLLDAADKLEAIR